MTMQSATRAVYGSSSRRDHLADAARQDREWNEQANTLERRIHALEALVGIGVAASLRQPAERSREAASEMLYAYSAHIDEITRQRDETVAAFQAELSEARVSLARALVLVRDIDDRIRGRRLKAFDDLTARALEFIADHQGSPF